MLDCAAGCGGGGCGCNSVGGDLRLRELRGVVVDVTAGKPILLVWMVEFIRASDFAMGVGPLHTIRFSFLRFSARLLLLTISLS